MNKKKKDRSTKLMSITMPMEMYKELKEYAKKVDRSVSGCLRVLVRDELERNRKREDILEEMGQPMKQTTFIKPTEKPVQTIQE